MADILFVTWDGGGNVPPALGIAAELAARGHDVRFLGHEGNRATVSAAGFTFTAYERAMPFTCLEVNPPERMVEIFNDAGIAEDVLHRAAHADVIVLDCLMLAALGAARAAGLTYVPLEHLFDHYLRNFWLRGPWGEVAEARGHAPLQSLDEAPLTLVATLRELDPAGQAGSPANLVFTGPVVTGRPAEPKEPTILVSLSTYNFPGQTEAMQNILDAVDGLPARVLVTTGPVIDQTDLRAPANTEVLDHVDHDLLMPETSLVIGHGGHATTMRALAHDLPLLVMPMHPMLDQPIVGQAIQDAGAGLMLAKDAAPDQIRTSVEGLLADGPHRAAASRLGKLVREGNGASTAADRIETLLRSAVPRG